jgi:hypothetical protein
MCECFEGVFTKMLKMKTRQYSRKEVSEST